MLALIGGAAMAAPPPPPPPFPPGMPRQYGDYDMQPIYAVYYSWVGKGREAALTVALEREREWQGREYWTNIVESELVHYDFRVIRKDRLDLYCKRDRQGFGWSRDCEYRYRYAFVPGSLYSDEAREKLILESFRPEELARLLASKGWKAPDSGSLWGDEQLDRAFEQHTDLARFYAPFIERHDVGSPACAALRPSLSALDKISLVVAPDRLRDTTDGVPVHGQTTRVRLSATAPGGGRVVVEGMQSLEAHLKPLWAAVEQCSSPSYATKGRQ